MKKCFLYIFIFFTFFSRPQYANADVWGAISTVLSYTFGDGLLEPCTKSAIKSFYGSQTSGGISTNCDEFEEPSLTDEVAGIFSSDSKLQVCSANALVKNITRAVGTGIGAYFGGAVLGYIISNVVGNALECLIISAKAKGGFEKAAEYEVCYSSPEEGSPLPYTDAQIAKLLRLSDEKISIENIVDKYNKLCLHKIGTDEYNFYKDGDIIDNIYIHHADGYAYVLCASVFSACPCIYNVGRGILRDPKYKRDENGVIQLDEKGHLAFEDDEEKRAYEERYARHCRIIRYKDLYENNGDLASIFDESCFDLHGYSKRTATITAGIVQCFENTARNIFEKPIMSIKQTSKTNQKAVQQYDADIGATESVYKYLKTTILQDRTYTNIKNNREQDLSELEKKRAIEKIRDFWFNDEGTLKVEYQCKSDGGQPVYKGTTMAFYDKYIGMPSSAVTSNCCYENDDKLYKTCFQDNDVALMGDKHSETNPNIATSLTMSDDYDNFTDMQKQDATRIIYNETFRLENLIEKLKIQKTKAIKANNAQMDGQTSFSMSLFDIFRNRIKALAVIVLTLWFFLLGWKMINGDFGKMKADEFAKMSLQIFLCYMVIFSESAKNYMFNLAIQTSQGVGMALNDIMGSFRNKENNSWNNACTFSNKASATPKRVKDGDAVDAIKVAKTSVVCANQNDKLFHSRYTRDQHIFKAYWKPECPNGYTYSGCEIYEATHLNTGTSSVCLQAKCMSSTHIAYVSAIPIEEISNIKSDAMLNELIDYYNKLKGYGAIYTYQKGKLENDYKDICISYGFNTNAYGYATDGIRTWNDVSCPIGFQDGKSCVDDDCKSGFCYKKICTTDESEEQCKNKVLTEQNHVKSLIVSRPVAENDNTKIKYDYTFSCASETNELSCTAYDPNDNEKCIESKCQPWKLECETGMALTCGRKAINADGSLSDKCLSGVCYKDLTDFLPRPPFERPYKVFEYYKTDENKWVKLIPKCHKTTGKAKTPIYTENDPRAEDPKFSSSENDYVYTCSEAHEKEGYVLDDGYRISDLIELHLIGNKNSDILPFRSLLSYEEQEREEDDIVALLKNAVVRTAVATIDSNGVVSEYDFIDDAKASEGSLRAKYRIYLDSKLKDRNKNADYPVLKKYGGTRSYKHLSFWDSMDCKIIQFLTFTGNDKGFQENVEQGIAAAENGDSSGAIDGAITAFLQFVKFVFMVFPFGIIVFALMFAIGAALFMLVARAAQQYVICVFNLVLTIYLSPFIFLLWLFDKTKGAMKSWLSDLQVNVVGACVPFVTISMFLFIIDWVMFGDSSKYVEENMFTLTGGINVECYDGHESDAPVGCLAVRLMKQFQMWDSVLNFLISWVAIFKKETWILAGYLIYRALFGAVVIVIMTLMLDKMEAEIYKLMGGKPDAKIGAGFEQSAMSSIKSGGMAGLEAGKFGFKVFAGTLKAIPKLALATASQVATLVLNIANFFKGNGDDKKDVDVEDILRKKTNKIFTKLSNSFKSTFNVDGRKNQVNKVINNIDNITKERVSRLKQQHTEMQDNILNKYEQKIADNKRNNESVMNTMKEQIASRTDLSQSQKDTMINEMSARLEQQHQQYENDLKSRMNNELNSATQDVARKIAEAESRAEGIKQRFSDAENIIDTADLDRMANRNSIKQLESDIETCEHLYE